MQHYFYENRKIRSNTESDLLFDGGNKVWSNTVNTCNLFLRCVVLQVLVDLMKQRSGDVDVRIDPVKELHESGTADVTDKASLFHDQQAGLSEEGCVVNSSDLTGIMNPAGLRTAVPADARLFLTPDLEMDGTIIGFNGIVNRDTVADIHKCFLGSVHYCCYLLCFGIVVANDSLTHGVQQ